MVARLHPSNPAYSVTPRSDIGTGTPPPSTPTQRTVRTPREIQLNLSAADQLRQVVLGKQRLGAQFIYLNSFNTVLYLVTAHCEGPVQSITPIADGTPLRNVSGNLWTDNTGLLSVWTYDGSQVTVDSLSGLTTFDPSWNEIHTGLAYSIIKLTFSTDLMNAIPTFSFDVQGYRSIFDPRTSTSSYTTNPALIVREVLTNTTWGLKVPTSAIDDAAFITAANDCDTTIFPVPPTSAPTVANAGAGSIVPGTYRWVYTFTNASGIETLPSPASGTLTFGVSSNVTVTVPVGGTGTTSRKVYRLIGSTYYFVGSINNNTGTSFTDSTSNVAALSPGNPTAPTAAPQPQRYYVNIALARDAAGDDWLNTLRAHCMGVITFDNGKYQLQIDKPLPGGYVPKKFSEAAFTDELGASRPSNVDPLSIQVQRKARTSLFNQVTINYLDQNRDFAPSSVTLERPSVTSGAEMPRLATYELHGVSDKNLATRLAIQYLNRAYDDLTLTFTASKDALSVLPLDVISFTGGGLSNQLFRVTGVKTKGEDFVINATEYQVASYSDVINADDSSVSSTLPDPFSIPPDATNLTLTEEVSAGPNGPLTSKIKVSWTPGATPFYETTKIVVDDGLNVTVWGYAATGPVYIPVPRRGVQHTVKLYTITNRNTSSPGVSATITPVLTGPVVPDVVNLSAPYVTDDDRGSILFTEPAYDFADRYEIYDMYGSPAVPPRIATVSAAAVAGTVRIHLPSSAIHGDGYATDRTFSVMVRVVSVLGDYSPGVMASWTIPAHGIASYTVGIDPRDCIFDGNYIWLSNYNGAAIQKFDRSTNTVTQTVTVGTKPYGITFGAGDLWVANFGSNTVNRVTTAGSVTQTISTGASTGPLGVIYDTTTSAVWVSCYTTGTVKKINPATNTITQTITVGGNPCLLYSYNGKIYVTNYASNSVSVINTTSNTVETTITVGAGPFGVIAANGFIYVANYSASSISKIDPVLKNVVGTITLGVQTGPTDLVYDGNYMWVSEAQARQITRVNLSLQQATAHIKTDTSPRTLIWDGTVFWTPNNQNASPAKLPVTLTNPSPGGGTSAPVNLTLNGLDVSPLPN
jgi:YVTN family beta-propeller protein